MSSASLPIWIKQVDSSPPVYHLALYCQPGAKKTEVQGEHDGRLKIRLAAPPVEGKANDALIAWLAKQLKTNRSQIELVAGDLSRLKRVSVADINLQDILNALLPSSS